MKKKKNKVKIKSLKQLGLFVVIAILFTLIEYIMYSNESKVLNNISNELTETNTINSTNINIGIEEITQYSGQIVITINNDVPYFEEKDITTEEFEQYSRLDELNRAGVAFANICKLTMPEERYQKRKYFIQTNWLGSIFIWRK